MPRQVIEWAINVTGDAAQKLGGVSKQADSLRGSINAAGNALSMASAAALAAGAAFKGFGDEISGIVDEMNTLAVGTGFTNEAVNGMRLAAAAAGKNLKDFFPEQLPTQMAQAAMGMERAAKGFRAIGVDVTDAEGNLRDINEVFPEVIDKLQAIESPTERAAAATVLLGQKGAQLLTAFSDSSSLDNFITMGEHFAINVGPDAVNTAGAWISANAQLELAFENVKQSLWDAFGSSATGLLKNFTLGLVFLTEKVKNLGKVIKGEMSLQEAHDSAMRSAELFYNQGAVAQDVATSSIGMPAARTGPMFAPKASNKPTRGGAGASGTKDATGSWDDIVALSLKGQEQTEQQSARLQREFGGWTPLFEDGNNLMMQQNTILTEMLDSLNGGLAGSDAQAIFAQILGPAFGPVAGIFSTILGDAFVGIGQMLGIDDEEKGATMTGPPPKKTEGKFWDFWRKTIGRGGAYERGTPYVARDEMALLHRGERVLTREENRQYSMRGGRSGGAPTIHVHNVKHAREFADRLQRELGPYGLNLSITPLEQ